MRLLKSPHFLGVLFAAIFILFVARLFSDNAKLSFDFSDRQNGQASQSADIDDSLNTAAMAGAAIIASSTQPSIASSSVTILIGGDVMFDRDIRKTAMTYGYDSFFKSVAPLFKTADIAVVNLEGPITSSSSKTLLPDGRTTGALSFTFASTTASALASAGVTLVSLANNHTDNFGMTGFKETKGFLGAAGIQWFGDPWNSSSTETVIEKNGIKVAFVGYHAFQPGFDRVISTVRSLEGQADFIIIMPHWGTEYAVHPSDDLKSKAQALVAAGANAVIGSHPHVVMDHEWIGGAPVFYSLGNLIFDQYSSPEVMQGNLIELRLNKTGPNTSISGIKVYKTSFASHRYVEIEGDPETISVQ